MRFAVSQKSNSLFLCSQDCLEQIVDVTSDYNDAAIVTEQLKKELESEYSRARGIRRTSCSITPDSDKIRKSCSSSNLGDVPKMNRSSSSQSLKLEAVQEAQSIVINEPKAKIRFRKLVNRVRSERRRSCS